MNVGQLCIEIRRRHGPALRIDLPARARIGRAPHCEVRLDGWRVAPEHAWLAVDAHGALLRDGGSLAGTFVNGRRIGERACRVGPGDEIRIGGHVLDLHVADRSEAGADESATAPPAEDRMAASRHWLVRIHAQLMTRLDAHRINLATLTEDQLRNEVEIQLDAVMAELAPTLPADADPAALRAAILSETVGLGPIEALLQDASVDEIMINRYDEVFVERQGRITRHPLSFSGERALLGVIERIVTPLGRRIDEASPMVDARLRDGSRLHAVIAPLALKGAALTIRKFPTRALQIDDLLARGSLSAPIADFLKRCVAQRRNIIVSGGTGTGKTTLLNVLSAAIPECERIITIEDAAELRLTHANLVRLEARPPNADGHGGVTIRELLRNALRMRPDRIIIGECRGGEALDMLQAMNTGHAGSLTTLHANGPRDALARLSTLVLMAGVELPLTAIRDQIASAIDVVVQLDRLADGSRVVSEVAEVTGIEGSTILMQSLFRCLTPGDARTRCFAATGVVAECDPGWTALAMGADAGGGTRATP